MDSLLDRLRRSIAQRGYVGTLQLCLVILGWKMLPRFRRTEAQRHRTDAEFDTENGVDTGGVFRPKANQVLGQNWAFGGNYQAIDPSSFLQALNQLQLPFRDFTFIDLGSGKGRTLLLASLFPFKKVVGVEYCVELNEIARQNIAAFRPGERQCSIVEAHDGDAAEYQLPNSPLVLFLFHPFAEQVMSRVVNNVAESYRQNPRRIVVVYFIPNLAPLWEATGLFHRTHGTPAIFDTHPAPEADRKEMVAAAHALYLISLDACSQMSATLTC